MKSSRAATSLSTSLSIDRLKISSNDDLTSRHRVTTQEPGPFLGRQLLDAVLDVRRYPLWDEKKKWKTLIQIGSLLEAGADPNAIDSRGRTCLHYIATPRRSDDGAPYRDMINLLLVYGASPDIVDKDGNTPLILAASSNHKHMPVIIEKLILAGANSESIDSKRWTSLHHAAYHGIIENVRTLLSCGASPVSVDFEGVTPLHRAMENENVYYGPRAAIACHLKRAGANINVPDSHGATCLHYAIRKPMDEITRRATVHLLLNFGASVIHVDKRGYNALWIATQSNNVEVVRILLQDRKTEVNRVDEVGRCGASRPITALHIAVTNSNVQMLELLLKHGADPNRMNGLGQSLLFFTVKSRRFNLLPMMKLLLSHGADPHSRDRDSQQSLFEWLVINRRLTETRVLLEHGLDLRRYNPRTPDDFSPLHQAIGNSFKDRDMLSLLLEFNTRGALDLEHVRRSGCTPLLTAVLMVSPHCVELLLSAGANVDHVCSTGTPLEFAVVGITQYNDDDFYKQECIRLLLQAGAKLRNILVQILLRDLPENDDLHNIDDFQDPRVDNENDAIARRRLTVAKFVVKYRVLYESQNPDVTRSVEYEDMGGSVKLRSYYEACKAEIISMKRNLIHNSINYYDVLIADRDFHKRVRSKGFYITNDLFERNLVRCSRIYAVDALLRFENCVASHEFWEQVVCKFGQILFSLKPSHLNPDAYYLIIYNILDRLHIDDLRSILKC
ncbi:hypothetical protein QAD02_023991 [Eretmocerus hayati]|uniref:Uncharacterized protein n=1 Tax=Eretmocerus hayati TaxID=131215 RepID=A0ACC2PZL5_9HYME|nr:hypothetical protein QAD02_023991 [Eretmocerus hayati]